SAGRAEARRGDRFLRRLAICARRRHGLDRYLEEERLEDGRPQAGEERRPLGTPRHPSPEARYRLALGPRPRRHRRQRARRRTGARGHGSVQKEEALPTVAKSLTV